MERNDSGIISVDVSTYQKSLEDLAITITNKVEREGTSRLPSPNYITADLGVLLRHSTYTYDLLYYLHADERRQNDPGWRQAYSFSILSVIRSMIDALYNLTALLDNPGKNGHWFRASGYRQLLETLDEDEKNYGGNPQWDAHIAEVRDKLRFEIRTYGFDEIQVREQTLWPTLGTYLRPNKGGILTPHQAFLKTLTHGFWREYSGISHATFAGLKTVGQFYVRDITPHELRPHLQEYGDLVTSTHLIRAAAILLCTLTETQAFFKFRDANINARIHQVWNAMSALFEVKELFESRYEQLMKDKCITA